MTELNLSGYTTDELNALLAQVQSEVKGRDKLEVARKKLPPSMLSKMINNCDKTLVKYLRDTYTTSITSTLVSDKELLTVFRDSVSDYLNEKPKKYARKKATKKTNGVVEESDTTVESDSNVVESDNMVENDNSLQVPELDDSNLTAMDRVRLSINSLINFKLISKNEGKSSLPKSNIMYIKGSKDGITKCSCDGTDACMTSEDYHSLSLWDLVFNQKVFRENNCDELGKMFMPSCVRANNRWYYNTNRGTKYFGLRYADDDFESYDVVYMTSLNFLTALLNSIMCLRPELAPKISAYLSVIVAKGKKDDLGSVFEIVDKTARTCLYVCPYLEDSLVFGNRHYIRVSANDIYLTRKSVFAVVLRILTNIGLETTEIEELFKNIILYSPFDENNQGKYLEAVENGNVNLVHLYN